MDMHTRVLLTLLVVACLLPYISPSIINETYDAVSQHTYIVRVRPPPNFSIDMSQKNLENWYKSFLPPRMSMSKAHSPFIYTYSATIYGFAVKLMKDEAKYVRRKDGVLKVYQDILIPLLTTHTPDFLGLRLKEGAWENVGMGEGVIIGLLDTGIDFAHISFDDNGMPLPPKKWHGSCNFTNVKCNNKIIGAMSFNGGLGSGPPQDHVGHGTHTASTSAGMFVKGASVLGSGNGTAAGMAPHAHIAMYQVCSKEGCSGSDILAGMEAAISDGVDILSLSLGGRSLPFYDDVIAIGAYSAMKKGIFVSCAAGNSGPLSGTLSNEAPWILTVGASTMDRQMKATVKLGDGRIFVGESTYQPSNLATLPLLYPSPGGNCFLPINMTSKIIACEHQSSAVETGQHVKDGGAAGLILLGADDTGHTTLADAHVLSASYINSPDAEEIRSYIKSSNNLTASITFNGTSLGTSPAPVVSFFSSRGPSVASPSILKPDIIGPGVNVIAAWPFKVGPEQAGDKDMTFNSISGTSMATPHLSGIAAIIKSAHPDWCPAAIKSAIMTTAYVVDDKKKPILDENLKPAGHFTIGAGHVAPSEAINPGLIYDLDETEYIPYLCGLDYQDAEVEIITHKKDACKNRSKIYEFELNYPSLAVRSIIGKLAVNRTVTNVGDAKSSYIVNVEMPKEVKVIVSPTKLEFTKVNEKKSFTLSLSWDNGKIDHAEGSFRWVSSKHVVRSPIVIF